MYATLVQVSAERRELHKKAISRLNAVPMRLSTRD
jgi:hypothetical protein